MNDAAKRKSTTAEHALLRWLLLMVVASFLPQTHVWSFTPTPLLASGKIAVLVSDPSENTLVSNYDGSDSLAAKGGGGTTLFRAVGPDELADIGAAGGRYRVPAGGTEGKYFFQTPEQASNFARMMGDKPYTTTSVTVSPSQLGQGQPINPAREGPGYFFDTPHVPSGPVNIFNHSKLP